MAFPAKKSGVTKGKAEQERGSEEGEWTSVAGCDFEWATQRGCCFGSDSPPDGEGTKVLAESSVQRAQAAQASEHTGHLRRCSAMACDFVDVASRSRS